MATETAPEILEVTGEEILSEFAKIMLEWGHYKTAAGLRYPTHGEAITAAHYRRHHRSGNRRPDGTWEPIPDGRPLFVARQVRRMPPADPA